MRLLLRGYSGTCLWNAVFNTGLWIWLLSFMLCCLEFLFALLFVFICKQSETFLSPALFHKSFSIWTLLQNRLAFWIVQSTICPHLHTGLLSYTRVIMSDPPSPSHISVLKDMGKIAWLTSMNMFPMHATVCKVKNPFFWPKKAQRCRDAQLIDFEGAFDIAMTCYVFCCSSIFNNVGDPCLYYYQLEQCDMWHLMKGTTKLIIDSLLKLLHLSHKQIPRLWGIYRHVLAVKGTSSPRVCF